MYACCMHRHEYEAAFYNIFIRMPVEQRRFHKFISLVGFSFLHRFKTHTFLSTFFAKSLKNTSAVLSFQKANNIKALVLNAQPLRINLRSKSRSRQGRLSCCHPASRSSLCRHQSSSSQCHSVTLLTKPVCFFYGNTKLWTYSKSVKHFGNVM